jgi:hypothetical protein
MRLLLRVVFFEFAASWAMVLAGSVRAAMQIWPFVRSPLAGCFRGRAWRTGAGLLAGVAVVAGWPVVLLPSEAANAGGNWLKIAIPWWILVGALGAQFLVVRLARSRETG